MARDLSSVRDRLWLLVHDEDVRPLATPGAIGVSLVAATLSDLLLQGRIRVEQGRIYPITGRTDPAAEPFSTEFLQVLAEERLPRLAEVLRGVRIDLRSDPHDLYRWVYEHTRSGLVEAGLLHQQRRAVRGNRYQLAERELISSIREQVNGRVRHPHDPADLTLDVLCALAWALDLHTILSMPCTAHEADRSLRDITERIPGRAGPGSPLAILPHLIPLVRRTVADLARPRSGVDQ
jgi:hypothetical protein